jgi:hypothetical protein
MDLITVTDENPVWVETIKKPIFNQKNEFKGFISSTGDTTCKQFGKSDRRHI